MKNFSTWMIVLFIIMFWASRVIAAIGGELGLELMGLSPLNQTLEVILLFTTLVAVLLIIKRKVVGGLIYLLTYGLYFGTYVFQNVQTLLNAATGEVQLDVSISLMIAIIGLILPVAAMLDLLFDKSRQLHPTDKKTDWFYANQKYDRQMDERADKNNYRTL